MDGIEPPEKIRECYEGFREKLEKGVEEGDEGMKGKHEESVRILNGLPQEATRVLAEKPTPT